MRTVVLGPRPAELEALIARRRGLGLDTHDEVWKGEYHMAPAANSGHGYLLDEVVAFLRPIARDRGLFSSSAFNIGSPDDFRVPDWGLHRVRPSETWLPTAALVVEIESPDDESWDKLGFYAEHRVDEVVIVNVEKPSVSWLELSGVRYHPIGRSGLLGVIADDLVTHVDWPSPWHTEQR